MERIRRSIMAAAALAAIAACDKPNLRSTGYGYAPDTSAAPLTAPDGPSVGQPADLSADPSPDAGTATPR